MPESAPQEPAVEPIAAASATPPTEPTAPSTESPAAAVAEADPPAEGLDQVSIEELLKQASFEDPNSLGVSSAAPDATDFKLPNFQQVIQDAQVSSIDLLRDVDLNVKIELGRARMLVEDVLKLTEGSVVELDKLAGDPVDVFVNDRLVARGEVLVLNDTFCVRVNEIVAGVKEEGLVTSRLLLVFALLALALNTTALGDGVAPSDTPSLPHTVLGDQPLRGPRPALIDHPPPTPVIKPLEGLDFSRVGGALLAVIALIFLLRWFGKVFFPAATGKAQSRVVEVVSRSPLAPKQQVMLLRVGKRLLVVGDSAGQLSTLCEISDPDEVASMVGQLREEKSTSAVAFGSLFGRFSRKFDSDEAEVIEAPPEPTDRQVLMDETDEVRDVAAGQAEIDGLRDRVRRLAEQFKPDSDPA